MGPWYGSRSRAETADCVVRLLRATMAAMSTPQTANSALQRTVQANPDFLLPQRELSPSRAAVKTSFTRDFIVTPPGLFSLLVFRLITYNTEALRRTPADQRQVMFHSLDEWTGYLTRLRELHGNQSPDFYCNRNATGHQTQADRVIGNVSAYWSASQESEWTTHFANGPISFAECRNLINSLRYTPDETDTAKKSTKGKNKKPSPNAKLPQCGTGLLSQYLLCTDLAYAGVIKPPSVTEIAQQIYALKSGGLNGLRLLGYCRKSLNRPRNSSESSEDMVIEAFCRFFDDIDARLEDQEKEQMGWDPLMAEHTLCKVTRLSEFL